MHVLTSQGYNSHVEYGSSDLQLVSLPRWRKTGSLDSYSPKGLLNTRPSRKNACQNT